MKRIKLLSLFSGIGAFEKALNNINIPYSLVAYSEFEEDVSKAYSLIHNQSENLNLGDITKVDVADIPDFDIITYGFPCQDLSKEGKGKGLVKGETRSGLLYYAEDIIKHHKPKYAIAENVENLVSKRYINEFNDYLNDLENYGYTNYWLVLNARDYGVAQNRKRVILISIRKDIDTKNFKFPTGKRDTTALKDFLDDNVDEKYYLDINKYSNLIQVYKENGQYKAKVKQATKLGYDIANEYDAINIAFPKSETRRGRVGKGFAQTLMTSINQVILLPDGRLRYITPKEAFRLMGFNDQDFDLLVKNGFKDDALYSLAGNSIVVNKLEEIFKVLFI